MPRVFATKVWGFNPDRWAVLGFSRPGSRDALARDIDPDDWVLHIGTRVTGDTNPRDRGKLLGLARLGVTAIASEAGVEKQLWQDYLDRNNGRAKWPFGLPMVEAREFVDRDTLDEYDIIPRFRGANFGLVLGTNAIELTAEEAERVLAHSTVPARLYSSPDLTDARERDALRRKLRRSPILPAPGQRTATYEDQPGHTYALELVGEGVAKAVGQFGIGGRLGKRVFKVGYAIDVRERVAALNFAFPNLNSLRWKEYANQHHGTGIEAMAMEERIHNLLDAHTARGAGNTETFVCTEDVLMAAWNRALVDTSRSSQPLADDVT